ncbi:MAG: hypothetical protein Q8L89_04340 [Gammaproteobacteria bacterium]|nr:hypothetical protein [Gammaproteobacteria bacterium]
MTRYILTSVRTGNEIDVTYDDAGRLWAVGLSGTYTDDEHVRTWGIMPLSIGAMRQLVIKGVTIREVPADLTFETFYGKYAYKVDRAAAEAAWGKLKDSDRMAALEGIAKYERWLGQKGTAKLYPVRYISKRVWEWEELKKPIAVSR